jgi:hypothetical protein
VVEGKEKEGGGIAVKVKYVFVLLWGGVEVEVEIEIEIETLSPRRNNDRSLVGASCWMGDGERNKTN